MVLYLTRTKINGKEVEHQVSLDEITEPSINDINPMIYLRVSRPLKDDSKIDVIDLGKFYNNTQYQGLSFNITPDYTQVENSKEIIEKN